MELLVEYRATKKLDVFQIQKEVEKIVGEECHASGYALLTGTRDIQFTVADEKEFHKTEEVISVKLEELNVPFEIIDPDLEE